MKKQVSRRGFLAATSATAATSVVATAAITKSATETSLAQAAQTATLDARESFHGAHQAGIELELQTFCDFLAFDLKKETDRAAMLRWMSLLTDDINRLAEGDPVLADAQPQLALGPARLTASVGFGPGLFTKLNLEAKRPESLDAELNFAIDNLQPEFTGGDVLIHIACDDPLILAHASRVLTRDSLPFASVRYSQRGFTNAQGVTPKGNRQRNLMGQVDGTDNPALGSEDFNNLVWIEDGPEWIRGGTLLVLRRIAMKLDTWDQLGRTAKESVIGRKLDSGAPLNGENETDVPDFSAKDENGLSVIPPFAHIVRASPGNLEERFFRRPFNYDLGVSESGEPDAGLLWTAYMRNIEKQYLPVQRRLAEFDLLNKWTEPIGSAVFAIARGVKPGEVIAQELFG